MALAATILALFLAVAMTASALGKLTRMQPVLDNLDKAGVPRRLYPVLATIQVIGAVGLLVGIGMDWAGIAAGVGFFLYFVLAVGFHVRAQDAKGAVVPGVLGLLALAEAILRAA